jgi:hypothetical protein
MVLACCACVFFLDLACFFYSIILDGKGLTRFAGPFSRDGAFKPRPVLPMGQASDFCAVLLLCVMIWGTCVLADRRASLLRERGRKKGEDGKKGFSRRSAGADDRVGLLFTVVLDGIG